MKTAIFAVAAVSALILAPGLGMANTINGRLSQSQIDSYCSSAESGNAGDATFQLGNGKTVSGTVDCAGSGPVAHSASNTGADDNGTESANDSDANSED